MILTLWTRRWGCGRSWLLARRTSVRPWLCFHRVALALLRNLSEAQAPLQSTGASNTKTYPPGSVWGCVWRWEGRGFAQ